MLVKECHFITFELFTLKFSSKHNCIVLLSTVLVMISIWERKQKTQYLRSMPLVLPQRLVCAYFQRQKHLSRHDIRNVRDDCEVPWTFTPFQYHSADELTLARWVICLFYPNNTWSLLDSTRGTGNGSYQMSGTQYCPNSILHLSQTRTQPSVADARNFSRSSHPHARPFFIFSSCSAFFSNTCLV